VPKSPATMRGHRHRLRLPRRNRRRRESARRRAAGRHPSWSSAPRSSRESWLRRWSTGEVMHTHET